MNDFTLGYTRDTYRDLGLAQFVYFRAIVWCCGLAHVTDTIRKKI